MSDIRLYTKPGCPYCEDAKEWLQRNGCSFEVLDITKDVKVLREWREVSGGVGVPVLAHGRDIVVGFNPERYADFLTCCRQTTAVDPAEAEAMLRG